LRILATLRGALTLALIVLNTVLWGTPLLLLAVVKLAMPGRRLRESLSRGLIVLAENWVSTNSAMLSLTGALEFERRGDTTLNREEW
jgi:hypothetical protein